MTAFKNIVTAVTVATAAFGAIGTSALAGDYHSRPYGGGYGPGPGYGHGPRYGYHRPAPPPPVYYHERRRDRTGEKIAKGVAIGVGAIILGSILANQGRRHRY